MRHHSLRLPGPPSPAMIKLLSRLPWWVLYGLSTFIYFVAYYLIRHRHLVIREQLGKVFPNLSEAERENGYEELHEGEEVVSAGALELKAALLQQK